MLELELEGGIVINMTVGGFVIFRVLAALRNYEPRSIRSRVALGRAENLEKRLDKSLSRYEIALSSFVLARSQARRGECFFLGNERVRRMRLLPTVSALTWPTGLLATNEQGLGRKNSCYHREWASPRKARTIE